MQKEQITKIGIIALILISLIILANLKTEEEYTFDATPGFELLAEVDFDKEEVISRGYPTMLDIGGADCIPCRDMAKDLRELNEELMGKAIIKFIDYWKYPELANQFEFSVIPTQFFYDESGELIKTHSGSITKKEMLEIFREMGYEFNE